MLRSGIEWVLFDAVGTLIYADPPVAEAYHAIGRRHGSRLSVEEIAQRFSFAFRRTREEMLETSEAAERARWQRLVGQVIDDVTTQQELVFEALWDHFSRSGNWRVFEDVPVVLAELQKRGFRVGIASNFVQRLRQIIAGHSVLAAVDAVFVSSEVGFAKPHRQFFGRIAERLKAAPEAIALVGDDEINDFQGALAVGWQSILLDRDFDTAESAAIRSLGDLL
jgi:putative hydrolase of the HAD superfamily